MNPDTIRCWKCNTLNSKYSNRCKKCESSVPRTDYKSKQVEALALIREELAMTLDGVNLLIEGKEPKDQPKYALEKINWTKETGPSGSSEKAVEQDNLHFRALINDLEAHDCKLQRNGYFLWLFSTGNTVGRKKGKQR